jgi:hypothetical protein
MLWSFLPWIIFFLTGLLFEVIGLIKNRGKLSDQQEWMTAGGFIITYCILGRSQAQLPHYIFIVFPLAAIITAKFLYRLYFTKELPVLGKILSGFHIFIFTLLWLLVIVLMAYPFAGIPKFVAGLAGLSLMFMLAMLFSKKENMPAILRISFFTIIGVNFFLNMAFYPTLLKFQMGSNAAEFINKQGISKDKVAMYGTDFGHSFHFYGQHIFPLKMIDSLQPGDIVVAPKDSLISLQNHFGKTKVLYNGWSYGVTQLSLPFLNPETREKELGKYVIVYLNK